MQLEIAEAENLDIATYKIPTNVRSSKSIFLQDHHHSYVQHVSNRSSYITGLKLTTAEYLHIVNYKIGGHYYPHFDYFLDSSELTMDNRIATVLFYVNI